MKRIDSGNLRDSISKSSRMAAQLAANAFADRVKYAQVMILLHNAMELMQGCCDYAEVSEPAEVANHAEPG